MKLLTRSLFIITLVFVMRTLSGCYNPVCPDDINYFDFSKVKITNLDNSGMYPTNLLSDTMEKAAVAFEINVSGDFPFMVQAKNHKQGFGFSEANAFSKENCPMLYKANSDIKNISVISLLKINESIPANTDISELFLATDQTRYGTDLYVPLSQLYNKINHVYNDYQYTRFQLFLTKDVENDSARFVINIKLADNSVLSDTSSLIYIR